MEDYISQYTNVFTGEGKLEGLLHLEIDRNVQPVQLPTRKVPIALREPLKHELDRFSNIGVIQKVDTPTSWISALVVTTKKNGKVRLCIDPKPLNETCLSVYSLLYCPFTLFCLFKKGDVTMLQCHSPFGLAQ